MIDVLLFLIHWLPSLIFPIVLSFSIYVCVSTKTTTTTQSTPGGPPQQKKETKLYFCGAEIDNQIVVDKAVDAVVTPENVAKVKAEAEKEAEKHQSKTEGEGPEAAGAAGDKKKSKEKSKKEKSKKSAEKKSKKSGGGGNTDKTQKSVKSVNTTQQSVTIDKTQRSNSKSRKVLPEGGTNADKNLTMVKLVDAVKASSKLKTTVNHEIQKGRFTLKLENYEDTYAVELSTKSGGVVLSLHNDIKSFTIAWGEAATCITKFDTPKESYTYLTFNISDKEVTVVVGDKVITTFATKPPITEVTTITTYGLERPPIYFATL